MILSPKEKFQQSQIRTGQWAQIVGNHIFDEACDHALLQMQEAMPTACSHDMDIHQQLVGARDLVHILKTIHEKPQETTQQKTDRLNYQAGV